jgi:tRNA(adenine34) deaminase
MSGESIFSDEYFMRIAVGLAQQAAEDDEIPVGAVVITDDFKIIGKGYNQTEKLHDISAHAEMIALTASSEYLGSKYLTGCTIYVTVEPCPMCAAALGWAQISGIVFGTPDPKKGFSNYQPSLIHPKTIVKGGVLMEECSTLMKDFFAGKR